MWSGPTWRNYVQIWFLSHPDRLNPGDAVWIIERLLSNQDSWYQDCTPKSWLACCSKLYAPLLGVELNINENSKEC